MWESILTQSNSVAIQVWVAVIDQDVCGFCSIGPMQESPSQPEGMELYTLYLRPGFERQGIGSALLEGAEQGVRDNGATLFSLWVLHNNERARRFYEARNWVKVVGSDKTNQMWGQEVREVRYTKTLDDTSV